MSDRSGTAPLAGRRIALLETREAERLGWMLREQGADVASVPAVAIVLPQPDIGKDGVYVVGPECTTSPTQDIYLYAAAP